MSSDAISRQAVLDLIEQYNSDGLGSVFYGYEEGEKFANAVKKISPINPQDSASWCTDCKEYDQDEHCCHRFSKVIRDTVEEMKQESVYFPPCVDCNTKMNEIREAYDKLKSQEPIKGEWIRMSDLSEQEDDRYQCSRCGNVVHYKNKMNLYTFNRWCGRCGSDNDRKIEMIRRQNITFNTI